MINTVVISGRITKDLEVKKTNAGKSVITFTLATDNGYGEKKSTYFLNFVAWERLAELIQKYCKKGDLITVHGKLTSRSYESNGSKVYVTEVVVDDVQLPPLQKADKKEDKSVFEQQHERRKNEQFTDDLFSSTPSIDVNSEDLPFY